MMDFFDPEHNYAEELRQAMSRGGEEAEWAEQGFLTDLQGLFRGRIKGVRLDSCGEPGLMIEDVRGGLLVVPLKMIRCETNDLLLGYEVRARCSGKDPVRITVVGREVDE